MSTLNEQAVPDLIAQLAQQIETRLASIPGGDQALMVGIHTGGAWVARQLHQALGFQQPLGTLDISFYRDDFTRVGVHPQVRPSQLPLSLDGKTIILVDDVLYTGRTIRAALNELFDYGRPERVILAVLIDRGRRELPIQPDCVALRVDLPAGQQVKLCGPEPLTLETHTKD